MAVEIGTVQTFPDVEPDKDQAVKVLEEAAEVFAAWQQWNASQRMFEQEQIIYECADVIQAVSNLLSALGVADMTPYVELCRKKNEVRGRFGGYCFSSREGHSDNVDTFLNDFVNLLDRQAAITQYEWEVPLMKAGHDAVETEREIARKKYEELQAEIAKRDKGIERLKRSRDALKEERDKLMEQLTEARTLPSVLELEEALRERDELKRERALMNDELEELEQERDAYRELCGRFRKMANEMLGVEVD